MIKARPALVQYTLIVQKLHLDLVTVNVYKLYSVSHSGALAVSFPKGRFSMSKDLNNVSSGFTIVLCFITRKFWIFRNLVLVLSP